MFRALTRTALLAAGVAVGAKIRHQTKSARWLDQPDHRGRIVSAGGRRVFARVEGKGGPTVVVVSDLASPSASWWPVQELVSPRCTVLTFDRAGAGWSEPGAGPRSSGRVVEELRTLMRELELPGPFVVVGHGQGALYAQHLARDLADESGGVVLVEPVTTNLEQLRDRLGPELYARSGADRSIWLRRMRQLSRLGLHRLLRPLPWGRIGLPGLRRLPPDLRELCWQQLMLEQSLEAAEEELFANGTRANTDRVLGAGPFPAVPVRVLWHDPELEVARHARRVGREAAAALEEAWVQLVRSEVGALGEDVRWRAVTGAVAPLHLEAPGEVARAILEVVASARGRSEAAA